MSGPHENNSSVTSRDVLRSENGTSEGGGDLLKLPENAPNYKYYESNSSKVSKVDTARKCNYLTLSYADDYGSVYQYS